MGQEGQAEAVITVKIVDGHRVTRGHLVSSRELDHSRGGVRWRGFGFPFAFFAVCERLIIS